MSPRNPTIAALPRCRAINHESSKSKYHFLDTTYRPSSNALTRANCISHIDQIIFCSMSVPRFFQQPLRYLRWASHEKPAIFYSFVIASGGPLSFVIAPPIRRYFNDGPREKIPLTYPSKYTKSPHRQDADLANSIVVAVPPGPRKIPEGYDD